MSEVLDLAGMTGLRVDVLRPRTDCSNGGIASRFDRVLVVSDLMERCPVEAAGTPTDRVLQIVGNPRARGRFLARPIDSNGRTRSGMFGGNFVYTSDARFTGPFGGTPVPVHDRFEDDSRRYAPKPHEVIERTCQTLRLLPPADRAAALTDLLIETLNLGAEDAVPGYYWGRNRGGRHQGLSVLQSFWIEGQPAYRLAPVLRRSGQPTASCRIDFTRSQGRALLHQLVEALQLPTGRRGR